MLKEIRCIKKKIILTIVIGIVPIINSAAVVEKITNISKPLICQITPEIIADSHYPNSIHTSNNLRREQGGGFIANGLPIIITGFVMDEDCLPLTNATITIWHTNTYGSYQLETIKDNENNNISKNKIDLNFMGNGQSYTDNTGMYHFLTILPGSYEKNPPYINISIQHNDFPDFDTIILFPMHHKNTEFIQKHNIPSELSNFIIANQIADSADNEKVFLFNVTLPGKNNYKRY
ncbi:putative Dioxygenase [Candidatus Xenohaliotis californiensis]|uniref:Dioxygenase n=1 Tax=Candidatus Xenohaliotis californiensis TaxID=84677 RepID=A0ABM9N8K7_9RICK|nr:putative Dioxygenase [Candidatus Xenohaliotis californiensis]